LFAGVGSIDDIGYEGYEGEMLRCRQDSHAHIRPARSSDGPALRGEHIDDAIKVVVTAS
jgi:hypothetical protein